MQNTNKGFLPTKLTPLINSEVASQLNSKSSLIFGDKERKIFSLIEFDAEAPVSNIAKRLRMSAGNINYAIRKLRDERLLMPKCFINSFRLGFLDIGFYFSLSEQTAKSRERLIKRFSEHPNVAYFGSVLGDFQYLAVILAKDLNHFSDLLSDLTGGNEELVSDKQIVPRLSITRYARKYLYPSLASKRTFYLRSEGPTYELDELDEKVVWALGNRPYDSLRELARFLGQPLATIDRRMKRLRESGVVQGILYNLDVSKLGIQCFRVLIHIQGLSCSVRQQIRELCTKNLHVTYLVESLGSWDFEIGIETFDPRIVSKVVEELHTESGHRISGVQVLMELDDFICRHYPGKLGSGAPRT